MRLLSWTAGDGKLERFDFFFRQGADGAHRQIAEPHGADSDAFEPLHLVTDAGQQAADLAIAAFVEHHFQNRRLIFPEVDNNKQFGLHIYGAEQATFFVHVSWLFDPSPLLGSLDHDGTGDLPGLKSDGEWDIRSHKARLVLVNDETLIEWRKLLGEPGVPLAQTKLIYPVTTAEQGAIAALTRVSRRLGDMKPQFSRGYDEAKAKKDGIIRERLRKSSGEAILAAIREIRS